MRYLLLAIAVLLRDADSPDDLLRKVIENRGDVTLITGEFQYTLTIRDPGFSEDAIKSMAASSEAVYVRRRKDVEAKLKDAEPELRNKILGALTFNEAALRASLEANKNRSFEVFVALGNAGIGGDRYVEYVRLDGEGVNGDGSKKGTSPTETVLQRPMGAGNGVSLYSGVLGALVKSGIVAVGKEPQGLGRVQGGLHLMAEKADEHLESATSGVMESDDPELNGLVRLECRLKKTLWGINRIVCAVDVSRGYITPLIEEYDEAGRVVRDWHSTGYFKPTGSELWFPEVCTCRELTYSTDATTEPKVKTEVYRFTPARITLNTPVSAERLKVQLAPGTSVLDTRTEPQTNLVTKEEVELSVDALDDLSAVKGLVKNEPGDESTVLNPSSRISGVMIALAVSILAIAVITLRKRGKSVPPSILLIGVLLNGAISGCAPTATPPGERNQPASLSVWVQVSPASLQIGDIAADGRDVDLSFSIKNVSLHSTQVELVPSCGCTTISPERVSLSPGENCNVDLSISTRGRSGDFHAEVAVKSIDEHGYTLSKQILPIEAFLRDDWRASPQRVIMGLRDDGTRCASFSVTAPTTEWDVVSIGPVPEQCHVTTLSVDDQDGRQVRHFEITALASARNHVLTFQRDEQSFPVISIPVLVER